MADEKQEKKNENVEQQPDAFADRNRNLLTVAVVGGLMLLEGLGIFLAVNWMSGDPDAAAAADMPPEGMLDEEGNLLPPEYEVEVTNLMAFNNQDGRIFVYQIGVYAVVETEHRKKIQDFFDSHHNTIQDRLLRVIRACDPKFFKEPDLNTIKRQFKHELDQILGDDTLILRVLFPEFNQSRAD